MRPSNRQQAIQHMDALLRKKLKGNKQTRVREKITRARNIAATIYDRFQVGPYQYQVKHLRWYLEINIKGLKSATRYRYWLTAQSIVFALGKDQSWLEFLKGDWIQPAQKHS